MGIGNWVPGPRCGLMAALLFLLPAAHAGDTAARVEPVALRTQLVYAGKAGWVAADRARELGYIEYRGRWLPGKYKRKLATWERKDARISGWSGAYKARSKNYRIETDIPHFVTELEVKPFLDELYRTYTDVFKKDFGLRGRGANKKEIRIYHGYPEYARLAKGPDTQVPRSNPGFILNGKEIVVYYAETEPETFYSTVFHEGAHQFVKNLMPGADLPLWLDEAMAVYFEGCRYKRSTGEIVVGHLPPDRLEDAQKALAAVKPARGVSLPETMFMHTGKPEFRTREYALAWSFVYYLIHVDGGKHKKKFARFLKALNGGGKKPIAMTFRKAFGVPLADLSEGWRSYILSLELPAQPRSLELEVEGEGIELRTGDRLWSIDGRLLDAPAQFDQVWPGTPPEEDTAWVVVRRDASGAERFVNVVVPAGSAVSIRVARHWRKKFTLVD